MTTIKSIFLTAAAWPSFALFWLCRSFFGPSPAVFAGLVYTIFYLLAATAARKTSKLDYGLLGYWLVGLGLHLFNSPLSKTFLLHRQTTFIYLALFLAAVLPLLLQAEPFTIVFARRRTPRELWETNQFKNINNRMTLVWSLLFGLAGLISLGPGLLFKIILPVSLMLGVGLPFTRSYPGRYLKARGIDSSLLTGDVQEEQALPSPPAPSEVSTPSGSPEPVATTDETRRRTARELGPVKNALVIFGSPRGGKGATHMVLEKFLAGLHDNGVTTETVYLHEKRIKPCIGCFTCWTKTPGRCIQQDDMLEIFEIGRAADLVIHAHPLYVFSVPGIVKNFLDRRLPLLDPYLEPGPDGLTTHPKHDGHEFGRRQLIFSVCGFPEIEHFEPMLAMYRAMARVGQAPIVGEILRPASESLRFGESFPERFNTIMDGVYSAGAEVASQGYVSRAVEQTIAQPLFPLKESFHQVANRFWDARRRFEEAKRADQDLDMTGYLAEDPGLFVAGMASLYDPAKAGPVNATFQFDFSGDRNGQYHIILTRDRALVGDGPVEKPDITIRTPFAVWQQIADKEISGEEALAKGLYSVEGDIRLLLRMQQIFPDG